ncbi:MAG: hypothetical protein RKE49_13130 [Oceanicaulis sp.]
MSRSQADAESVLDEVSLGRGGLSRRQALEVLDIARTLTAQNDLDGVLQVLREDRNLRTALRELLSRFASEEAFGARNRRGRRTGFFAGVAFTLGAAVLVAAGPRLFPEMIDTLPALLQDPLIRDAAAVVLGGLSMLVKDSVSWMSGGYGRPDRMPEPRRRRIPADAADAGDSASAKAYPA